MRVQIWDLLREEVLKARALEEGVRIPAAVQHWIVPVAVLAGLGGLRPPRLAAALSVGAVR